MNHSPNFGEFYKKFGFSEYPFSVFTSESEQNHGKDLFVDFSMYSPIIEGFLNGRGMILAGDRGTGKTAIIYDFCRRSSDKDLIVNISDYSELDLQFSSQDFYKFLIRQLSEKLFSKMIDDRRTGRNLTKSDRIQLSYYLAHYVKQATKNELQRKISALQTGWFIWFCRITYEVAKIPLNIGANAAVMLLSDLIAQAAGTPKHEQAWREYFPEPANAVDNAFSDPEYSFSMLQKLVSLAKLVGYDKVAFVLDKVDEDSRLNNAAEEIQAFIETVATDNKFLTNDSFQVILSLWVIPFNMLKDKVRTQKIFCPQVSWDKRDLTAAADRRVSVFSKGMVSSVGDLFTHGAATSGFTEMLALSNRNPRDLWHLLDKSFRAQFKIDPTAKKICTTAITQGIDDFVCQFNFYEYYPRRSNSRANSMDIYAYIKHLLKLDSAEFTKNQLNDRAGTGSSTQNYVSAMESMGLVERSGSAFGSATFKIRDPKVVHALANKLEISRSI